MSIISQAKLNVNDKIGYCETHHIIPRSMGGSNAKDNLVKLTAKEHFVCHLLLTKMTNSHKMAMALQMMLGNNKSSRRYVPGSSKIYEFAKKRASLAKMGVNNPIFGRKIPCTEDRKNNISKALHASIIFKESRASDKFRKKISDIQSNETLLVSVETGKIISSWKNCRELSAALGCTYANVKNARRDKRPIGKRFANEKCFVIFKKDFVSFSVPP